MRASIPVLSGARHASLTVGGSRPLASGRICRYPPNRVSRITPEGFTSSTDRYGIPLRTAAVVPPERISLGVATDRSRVTTDDARDPVTRLTPLPLTADVPGDNQHSTYPIRERQHISRDFYETPARWAEISSPTHCLVAPRRAPWCAPWSVPPRNLVDTLAPLTPLVSTTCEVPTMLVSYPRSHP